MINWDRVQELQQEIGEDDFGEVVVLFLEEVEEVVERLRAAPDPARMADDMHFLKGSALNLGFAKFAGLCQTGERQAAAGGTVDVAAVLSLYAASKDEFLRRVPVASSGAAA